MYPFSPRVFLHKYESINIDLQCGQTSLSTQFVFKSRSSRFEEIDGLSNSVRFPSREMAITIFLPPFLLSFFLSLFERWSSLNDRVEKSERRPRTIAVVAALLLRNFIKSSHDLKKRRTWRVRRGFLANFLSEVRPFETIIFFFFLFLSRFPKFREGREWRKKVLDRLNFDRF